MIKQESMGEASASMGDASIAMFAYQSDREAAGIARAINNGYQPGKHKEEDASRGRKSYVPAVKKGQDRMLNNWIVWSIAFDQNAKGHTPTTLWPLLLGKNCQFPPLVNFKDFFQYYILKSVGRLSQKKKPTLDSIKTAAEFFFAGFTRYTEIEVAEEDRHEIYHRSGLRMFIL
ncbi:hypothetical protein B0I35DRAFT_415167 [Stachybotrys elegans]|uniref:Uncharacterized protein n=1 Tax=Stachybotrys elegans TaxID=80388 RepID=A0A8K0SBL1_9HYPO|nr:hypothetical protein B0I35DRAFT_415167 [Stachybotrys elegans]